VAGVGKAQKSFKHVELKPATCYAAEDADVTLRLWRILKPRLAREGLLTVYETLERGMPAVLADMERSRHPRRSRPPQAAVPRVRHAHGRAGGTAHELAGRPFNVGSQADRRHPVRRDGPARRQEDRHRPVGAPAPRARGAGPDPRPAAHPAGLAPAGEAEGHLYRRPVEAADPATNRVHTSYQLAAATTGRLASSDPNLQNIPVRTEIGRQIRQAFIAAPGHVLISADYSQIELRLLAHIGDIPELKRAFRAGLDIHAATASEMFGVPVEGMPPRPAAGPRRSISASSTASAPSAWPTS
jgi:DNA polymerase-1